MQKYINEPKENQIKNQNIHTEITWIKEVIKMKETVEERMIRVVFEDGKSFGLVGILLLINIY